MECTINFINTAFICGSKLSYSIARKYLKAGIHLTLFPVKNEEYVMDNIPDKYRECVNIIYTKGKDVFVNPGQSQIVLGDNKYIYNNCIVAEQTQSIYSWLFFNDKSLPTANLSDHIIKGNTFVLGDAGFLLDPKFKNGFAFKNLSTELCIDMLLSKITKEEACSVFKQRTRRLFSIHTKYKILNSLKLNRQLISNAENNYLVELARVM